MTPSLQVAAAVFLCIVSAHGARAASIDCETTQSLREAALCADREFLAQDAELNKVYQQRSALLTRTGAGLLRDSQRNWLQYLDVYCAQIQSDQYAPTEGRIKNCLATEYQARLVELRMVGGKIGPFTFSRIDMFKTWIVPASRGGAPHVSVKHIAYPQIDAPSTAMTKYWNQSELLPMPQKLEYCDGPAGSESTDYALSIANQRLISLVKNGSFYCKGTPHGSYSANVETLSLGIPLRPIERSDMFLEDADTDDKLRQLFVSAMTREHAQVESEVNAVRQAAVNPGHWLFGSAGITLLFSAYEGGCYACDPGEVSVSWDRLRPLMKVDSPVP